MNTRIKLIAEWWNSLDPEVRIAWYAGIILALCIAFVGGVEGGAFIGSGT